MAGEPRNGMAGKSMKLTTRSPTFAGLEGGLIKIKSWEAGARAFALAKVCMELGKPRMAKSMAQIASKEYMLMGKRRLAAMAAKAGGLTDLELEGVTREAIEELIGMGKCRRAKEIAKASGFHGLVRKAAMGMAKERMETGDVEGARKLGRKYGFNAEATAERPSEVPAPREPGECTTMGECTIPGRI